MDQCAKPPRPRFPSEATGDLKFYNSDLCDHLDLSLTNYILDPAVAVPVL